MGQKNWDQKNETNKIGTNSTKSPVSCASCGCRHLCQRVIPHCPFVSPAETLLFPLYIWGAAKAFKEHVHRVHKSLFLWTCRFQLKVVHIGTIKNDDKSYFVQLDSLEVSQQQHIWREPTSGLARCIFHHCVADFTHLPTWTRRKKA